LILLSTWNGARYLPEQLTSLLSQEYNGQLSVLIRDDGSQDDTGQIIEQMNDGRGEVLWGKNLGAKGSYLALLAEAYRRKPDFIAFADQDDLWLPGKLLRAADALSRVNGPALFIPLAPVLFYMCGLFYRKFIENFNLLNKVCRNIMVNYVI